MILAVAICVFDGSRELQSRVPENMHEARVAERFSHDIRCDGRVFSAGEGNHNILRLIFLRCVLDKGKGFVFEVAEPVLIGADKFRDFFVKRSVVNVVG